MRFINLLLICLSCFLLIACLVPEQTQEICTHASQVLRVHMPVLYVFPTSTARPSKGFEYYAIVYLQWIILGAYIITTLLMAFYTKKRDKKKVLNIKKVADTLLVSRRGRPGMLLRLFHLLFRFKKK